MQAAADAVVRLPIGDALESALLTGVPDADIVAALQDLGQSYTLPLPAGWEAFTAAPTEGPGNEGAQEQ